ncbi:MAG: amino acid adenylation domain-containing protein [Candidatus Sulfotelmatobacter sp.]
MTKESPEPVTKHQFRLSENTDTGAPNYWEGYLADVPVLELPTDRARPAELSPAIGVESCSFSESLTDGIQRLSQQTGVEVATLGLAAFSALLHRYTAQEKFAVGVGAGNGEFLPVVAEFCSQLSFRQLLLQLDAAVDNARKAEAFPPDLATRLGIVPDPSRHPIFQVAFSSVSPEVPSTPPDFSQAAAATRLDLHLEFLGGSAPGLSLHYCQDLFERSTASRMLEHMQQLLAGAIEDINRSCAKLPMLTESELHEQLLTRNNTARSFPQRCLHELVEDMSARVPSETAVIYAQQQLSYGELNARANQVAHYLRKRGLNRNGRVGICLKRSVDFAVAILGVLKAAGVCVPLDPTYPGERLSFMLSDAAAPLLLTERGLLQAAVPQGTAVLYLSEERDMLAREPRGNVHVGSLPSDVAYIIYTSGSTGRPRGVLLTHAGLANYMVSAAEMFALRPGDRMLQFCSISFDAALEEIFSTWAAGATLVFRTEDLSLELSEFVDWAARQRITVMDLPTAYWHEWVYAMPGLSQKVPSALRLVIVGGEKSSVKAYSTWHKFVGNRVRWVNTYGPAEASVVSTAYEPKLAAGDEPPALLPIGRPVANVRVYLLDPDLNLVPVGVPGELHIGGAGVARGYLNLPQLTEQKFIPDIFSDDPSARLYKTGDLARYLPSGDIEFLGRRDNQVKIRGFRIEPGEIESVLGKHPEVQEAAVVQREDETARKRLMTYVVRSRGKVTESELRRHVQERLPEYMVPSEFVFLEAMPLTPNGKIDRRALAALKSESRVEIALTSAAKNPVQAQLIGIWEQLLGRSPIGLGDNFFELGGDSLLAARLMHRVKQVFGKNLPLAVLLQAPTVEQLAAVLRDGWSGEWSSLVAMQPEGSKPPFFMVHGVGGNVLGFHSLARHMKPDHPFYGLQSRGLHGKHACHTRIEEMAAHYLDEIRTIQPTGPYHLGGFSLGGLVAYEMARQLLMHGESVSLLVLFDTYATNPKPVKLVDLLTQPSQLRLRKVPEELRRKVRRTMIAWRSPHHLKRVMHTNAQAAEQYCLQPYRGKALLLRAGDGWVVKDDPYAKWRELADELETIEIGGAHMDILREPQVGTLAECLKNCINNASADASARDREVLTPNIA